MAQESKADVPQALQVNTGDEMSRGRYSNNLLVAHSPEEFILDWLVNTPNGAHLTARVFVTPGHLKRIITALQDNLNKYEEKLGAVKAIEPKDQVFH